MRSILRRCALSAAPLALLALMAGCSGDNGGDDDSSTSPGDDDTTTASSPQPSPSPTPVPLTPTPATPTPGEPTATPPVGEWARAFQITDSKDLLSGPAAQGQVGDFMLSNDQIRVVIQSVGRHMGWGMFGGTIIDAGVVQPDGSTSPDEFGELSLFFNFTSSVNATSVEVLDDGSLSGTAKIVAEGEDDLWDVLQVNAAVATYGLTLPYEINADFPLRLRTTYTLGPNDRHVHVATEFINQSSTKLGLPVGDCINRAGGDVEEYIPNPDLMSYSVTIQGQSLNYTWGGFGEAFFSIPDFVSFFGGHTSYAYVPPLSASGELNAMTLSIDGVLLTVLGTTSILDVFTANKRALFQVPANGSAVLERDLVVGRDVASLRDEIQRMRKTPVGTLSGQVTEQGTGLPLAKARVSLVKDGQIDAAVTAFYTDAQGRFQGDVPPGTYGLIACDAFDFTRDGRTCLLTPVITTVAANATTTQDLQLEPTGLVSITVLNGAPGDGSPSPAKVTFYGPYERPPLAILDSNESLGSGAARVLWLDNGAGTFPVKPGTYDVVVARGFEYDLVELPGVVVKAGETLNLAATLTRVIDTEGYISGDLHVHGVWSPDSTVSPDYRVRNFLSEGVEVLVSTDHDNVIDYGPTIEAMYVGDRITSLNGDESTSFNMGHFNVFPLTRDESSRNGGALDWGNVYNLPIDPATGRMVDVGAVAGLPAGQNNLTPSQIYQAFEKTQPGTQVHQMNHPRGDLGGNFTVIGLDLSKLGTAEETSADPTQFRLPLGTDLFAPEFMTALEVQNGPSVSAATRNMNDWFALLNLGYRIAGTGVSDTHDLVSSSAGYARTFVAVSDDDVLSAHLDPGFGEDFAQGINDLRITCGAGLYVTATVGAGGGSATMGELLEAPGGQATLHIRVQAPDWSAFETVDVFANPVVYANVADQLSFSTPSDLGPIKTLIAGQDFSIEAVDVPTSRDGGTGRQEANIDLPLSLTEDTWLVVTVRGSDGELKPGLNKGDPPFAFTNPIFVDVNGDGTFTPPGKSHVLPMPPVFAPKTTVRLDEHGRRPWGELVAALIRSEREGKGPKRRR